MLRATRIGAALIVHPSPAQVRGRHENAAALHASHCTAVTGTFEIRTSRPITLRRNTDSSA